MLSTGKFPKTRQILGDLQRQFIPPAIGCEHPIIVGSAFSYFTGSSSGILDTKFRGPNPGPDPTVLNYTQ